MLLRTNDWSLRGVAKHATEHRAAKIYLAQHVSGDEAGNPELLSYLDDRIINSHAKHTMDFWKTMGDL